ncbi:MAG: hypothetical protein V4608_03365 [Bacteroidota bacterium]
MEYRVITYPNKSKLTPSFYIQMKGLHSGRPLRKPIKNCVAVYSEIPFLFEMVYLLFKGRKFEYHIIGTAIPFIRIEDLKNVINEAVVFYRPEKIKLLDQINKIDELLNNCQEQIKLFRMAQMAICRQFLK